MTLAEELREGAARRERVLQDIAGTLRRFARIETESVEMLLRAAGATADPVAAERRRQVAAEADKRGHLASQRADRVEQDILLAALTADPALHGLE